MGAALSGSPKFKFLNAEGRGWGRGGEGRGKETFSCLPPYAAVPVKRLKGGEGGGGELFHTCPHTQLLRRLKGNSLDSPLLPTILSTFKESTLFGCQ